MELNRREAKEFREIDVRYLKAFRENEAGLQRTETIVANPICQMRYVIKA
jgi:hypothetical protein